MLQRTLSNLLEPYRLNPQAVVSYWNEIEKYYSFKTKYYHNLRHLDNMLNELEALKHSLHDWNTTLFALFYHDIIYKATSNKNEEESANLAKKRLQKINYPPEKIEKCVDMILATKGHTSTGDNDTDLFTDADLSILGSAPALYQQYAEQVRKEYAIYPDFLYKPGRKKVLQHFLAMPAIFKTKPFQEKYEAAARKNIEQEFSGL